MVTASSSPSQQKPITAVCVQILPYKRFISAPWKLPVSLFIHHHSLFSHPPPTYSYAPSTSFIKNIPHLSQLHSLYSYCHVRSATWPQFTKIHRWRPMTNEKGPEISHWNTQEGWLYSCVNAKWTSLFIMKIRTWKVDYSSGSQLALGSNFYKVQLRTSKDPRNMLLPSCLHAL